MDWDNTGLLVGDETVDIQRVLLCLDVTEAVIQEAVEQKVQLIIAHHPIIFSPLRSVVTTKERVHPVYALIRHGIAVYVAHTNFDLLIGGLNDYVVSRFDATPLPLEDGSKETLLRLFEMNRDMDAGQFAALCKEVLQLSHVRLIGKAERPVKRIGLVTGSGYSEFVQAVENQIDLFVTGDIKYHDAQSILETETAVIDAGHYGTEKWFAEAMEAFAKDTLRGLTLIKSKIDVDPFNEC